MNDIDSALAEYEKLLIALAWFKEANAQLIFYELDSKTKRVEIRYRNNAGMLVFVDAEDLIAASLKAIAQAAGKAIPKNEAPSGRRVI